MLMTKAAGLGRVVDLWGQAWQVSVKETVRVMAVRPRALIQKAIYCHLTHPCRAAHVL